jgi:Alternate to MurJ
MDAQLVLICILTFVIHLIGTLAYSVPLTGIRTRRIAVSFALFNVLILISRTSNSFQEPFLAKRVEQNLAHPVANSLLVDFRWLLLSATCATVLGAFLIPTFQRLFSRAVLHFQVHRSIPRLLLHGVSRGGIAHIRDAVSLPAAANLTQLRLRQVVSPGVMTLNMVAVALWTVGVFAALYAGYLKPELRVTASTLSSIVNGLATILMFIFIDPQMSMMTDGVMAGRVSESMFRRALVWLVGSRFVGTLVAQLLLVPSASLIVLVAERL